MNRTLVWDLLVRFFHWLFAAGLIAAATIAFLLDDESPIFPVHALIGLTLVLMVVIRIIWGFVGTRYARFASFPLGPRALVAYFRGLLAKQGAPYAGHNPATSWAVIAMFVLMLGLGVTGYMMGIGNKNAKELHEVMANAMIAIAGAHVLGVLLHTLRRRENIALGMMTGYKKTEGAPALRSHGFAAAVLFLVVTGAWTIQLASSYDASLRTARVPVLGTVLRLGENEEHDEGNHGRGRHDDEAHAVRADRSSG